MVSGIAVHRKSRFGCQNCKKRKIKCDERRPTCGNCHKAGAQCHFQSIPPISSHNSASSSTSAVRNIGSNPAISDKDRLLELRLMHHYSTETSQDPFFATNDADVIELHTRIVPVLALQYQPLLNAIFSVAALHLHKLDPSNRDYETAHRRYYEAALSSQRLGVESISAKNAEAVCLTATAIAHAALLTRPTGQAYEPPILWLDLMTNHHTLFQAAWDYALRSNSRIVCLINAEPNLRDYWRQLRQPYPDIFPTNIGSIFPNILDFEASDEIMDEDRRSTYTFILGYIAHSLQFIEAREDHSKSRRRLVALSAMAPNRYRDLVREGQPRALILLAYFFAVLKAVDDVWWLRGLPEREVFGVQSILPEHWQWAMAWPLQKLAYFGAAAISVG